MEHVITLEMFATSLINEIILSQDAAVARRNVPHAFSGLRLKRSATREPFSGGIKVS